MVTEEAHVTAYQAKNRMLGLVMLGLIAGMLLLAYFTRGILFHSVFK
ncbi:MAG TPA: hypothetical protein V6D00_05380 [Pantanalinema sp.]